MTKTTDIFARLASNSYPGRGVVLGKSADGTKAVAAYFIMGRSENSRNRIFVPTEDGIRTEAFDPSKMLDPSLIIYHPVRTLGNTLIVTNGDQTDTVFRLMQEGKTFQQALATRCFEPDGPNWTPRISGLLDYSGALCYQLSILKSADAEGSACSRFTYAYEAQDGVGHFIHTYEKDGSPIPSFAGEPVAVALGNDLDELANGLWAALNGDNKVSLYVYQRDLSTGAVENRIINKNGVA